MEDQNTQTAVESQPEIQINQGKLDEYVQRIRMEQNLLLAIFTGIAAALIGAILWAVITVATMYQIGYMAVAVGFLVGYGMRITGKGIDKIFGYAGAALALVGCLLGNVFTILALVAKESGVSFFEVISMIDFSVLPSIMVETGSPIDLLFYGIAVYEGYRFSFRKITEEEIIQNAGEPKPAA